jgi:hypothetical protein
VVGAQLLAHLKGQSVVVRELVEVGLAQRIVGHGVEALGHLGVYGDTRGWVITANVIIEQYTERYLNCLGIKEVSELCPRAVIELLLRVAVADEPGGCVTVRQSDTQSVRSSLCGAK